MKNRNRDRRGLGRGLSALMADVATEQSDSNKATGTDTTRRVAIEDLIPNPNQPRRSFGQEALEELAASIRTKGVIQPLVVRPIADQPDRFEIIAGERRWRAAQLAQTHDLPVIVRDFTDTEVLEIAIIENVQRADLNPVEEATGYQQLIERFGHTQEQLAEAMGKSRSYIANLLRLLTLPPEVRAFVEQGKLSAGHARALITSDKPLELARHVIDKGLSVRETEALVRKPASSPRGARTPKAGQKDADTRILEQDLSSALGMSVVIDHHPGGEGRVIVRYKTLEQLDHLCQALSFNH